MNTSICEYLWLDGTHPTQRLRSKIRVMEKVSKPSLKDFPSWGFDGSSTNQAKGSDSDCILEPVYFCPNPFQGPGHYIVLCEVFNRDGSVHKTNKRSHLKKLMEKGGLKHDIWLGLEQEYTLLDPKTKWPYGWPENEYLKPQGPYYCAFGSQYIFGRPLVESHMELCLESGLSYFGLNAEVMPSQWEFQIGHRGFKKEKIDPLTVSDQMWVARYILLRLGEEFDVEISWDNKPLKGDWNGAGMHTNFSTKLMRDEKKGASYIKEVIKRLELSHKKHIQGYGDKLEERLTGLHETCSIDEFRVSPSDRGASIRIPIATNKKGYGYLEDRRPGANADPYEVSSLLLETVCDLSL